jgi:hypothetical protein
LFRPSAVRTPAHRRPNFIVKQRHASFRFKDEVRVGVVLPEVGCNFYEVARHVLRRDYRCAVLNDRVVIVHPWHPPHRRDLRVGRPARTS